MKIIAFVISLLIQYKKMTLLHRTAFFIVKNRFDLRDKKILFFRDWILVNNVPVLLHIRN